VSIRETRKPKRSSAKKTARAKRRPEEALLDDLVERAKVVRLNAHAPYSRYLVGAAIATRNGKVFEGCNVENASFGATICAERGAIMQMVAAGEREPVACAVVTSDGGSPCGICRQVLSEFARDLPIALVGLGSGPDEEAGRVVQLADLLPLAFELRT
jgi:cytidine deaminase